MPQTMSHPGSQDPRRRHPRLQTDVVKCDLGRLVDISQSGVRIAGKGKIPIREGQAGKLKLSAPGGTITVTAQTVWARRKGFRGYEMGLRFIDMKPGLDRAIEAMARFGFFTLDPGALPPASKPQRPRRPVRASFEVPDYYSVLGVGDEATSAEIREAFRKLARLYHPDVCREPDGVERFQQINEAYEVLKDPERRRMFDIRLAS